jgi:hypothetical protein
MITLFHHNTSFEDLTRVVDQVKLAHNSSSAIPPGFEISIYDI